MSMTVNDLIKLLDTEGNRYGSATGKPRELNISINGKFCGGIESAKLDGWGDGLVTDVTLEIEVPKMKEYYEHGIRNKAIDEFSEELRKYEDDDMWLRLKNSSIYEIAEQVKGVGE